MSGIIRAMEVSVIEAFELGLKAGRLLRFTRSQIAIGVLFVTLEACGAPRMPDGIQFEQYRASGFGAEVDAASERFSQEIARRYVDAKSYVQVVDDLKANGFRCVETEWEAGGDPTIFCLFERPRVPLYRDRWTVLIRNPDVSQRPNITAFYRIQAP